MKIVGVTGSSGSGKSTVANMLKIKYNAYLIDADKIAREITKENGRCIKEIEKQFGKEILNDNGELKRNKLAKIIYSDKKKREELNSITFKYISRKIKEEIKKAQKSGFSYIIIDAPLLFEINLASKCDRIIGVIAKKETKLKRIIARDNITIEDANARIKAQNTNNFLKDHCDYIVENNFKELNELETEIKKI